VLGTKKNILLFCILLNFVRLNGQQENDLKVRPILELRHHYVTFRGDIIKSNISASSPFTELAAGIRYRNFDVFLSAGKGQLTTSQFFGFELLNFQSDFSTIDFQFRYKPFRFSKVSPYIQTGIGYSWFSSFTDMKDANGSIYYGWSDGKFKDLPESDFNESTAKELQRDYVYETPLAIDQSTLYFPINIGLEYKISQHLRFHTGWQFTLLQSDNMDRSTSTAAWDHLQSFNLGLSVTLSKRAVSKKEEKPKEIPINKAIFKDVDFKEILYSDEDQDGVNDLNDQCYGTPKGAVVDLFGCPSDSDGDGVLDFVDKEIQSPTDFQIHADGKAWSEEETQKHFNDSIALFVRVLRKTSKNSRPYPVRKYIPEANYRAFDKLLELHPEWNLQNVYQKESIPEDLMIFDMNKDGRITLQEIETLTHRLFDGSEKGLTQEKIQKAITYVFQHQ
jgi:opacity protein-like surface antigen